MIRIGAVLAMLALGAGCGRPEEQTVTTQATSIPQVDLERPAPLETAAFAVG